MTNEELHNFAVQTLMEEYAQTIKEVKRYDKISPYDADFYFINVGKRRNVLVIYNDDLCGDISNIDTSYLIEDYHLYGYIPRVTFAAAWCIDDDGRCKDGKPAICGGNFCFTYYSVSLLPDEENEELDKELSAVELAAKYVEAWDRLDASIIEPYLDKDFHYASDWVFDELPCRAEYLDYFKPKLHTIGRSNNKPYARIGRNHQTAETAVLLTQRDIQCEIVLEIKDGRIMSGHMQEYSGRFKAFNPQDELYMNHGDHISAIKPAYTFMREDLGKILHNSIVWKKSYTQVTTRDMYEKFTDVCSLIYGQGDMKMMATIAYNKEKNVNQFMSVYPLCTGVPLQVKIEKVLEWDNQIEATVFCSIDEFHFAFFAVDYYCNKLLYKTGQIISVDLSALAMKAREGQQGFSLEGRQAIDWLTKIGEKPTYDISGNVEPVKFNLKNLVAFLNVDTKCPDEADFQSPIGELETTSIMGVHFYRTTITICRRETNEGTLQVNIPLYFRQEFFPQAHEGDPITGWLWVCGSLTGRHEKDSKKSSVENPLAVTCAHFKEFMRDIDLDQYDNLMFILHKLPLLTIRDGHVLDAFYEGDHYGNSVRTYCHKTDASLIFLPQLYGNYKENMTITQMLSRKEAESVPAALPYFDVPFTEQGIMQAWLLDNLSEFLPKGWHAAYTTKTFLFDIQRFLQIFQHDSEVEDNAEFPGHKQPSVYAQILKTDLAALLPKITISGDNAVLEYAYWNNWSGLVKATVNVTKSVNSVRFGSPRLDVIIEYKSSIRF